MEQMPVSSGAQSRVRYYSHMNNYLAFAFLLTFLGLMAISIDIVSTDALYFNKIILDTLTKLFNLGFCAIYPIAIMILSPPNTAGSSNGSGNGSSSGSATSPSTTMNTMNHAATNKAVLLMSPPAGIHSATVPFGSPTATEYAATASPMSRPMPAQPNLLRRDTNGYFKVISPNGTVREQQQQNHF